ncbi:hypothetical protein EB72_15140, partial [Mycobacterium sp. SWH-M1]
VLGAPVHVPAPAEYVALGAARQAAWALAGGKNPPSWSLADTTVFEADPTPEVLDRYRSAEQLTFR